MLIKKPDKEEYPEYYDRYIKLVDDTDLVAALKDTEKKSLELFRSIPEEKSDYRYDSGKWNIKEIILHINDAERVFAYRALRFARNDKTELSGFDENHWVPESNANLRSLENIVNEHVHVRQSSLSLFENLTEEMSKRSGRANGKQISVRALGFIICGHALHHLKTIQEKYLK